MAGLCCTPLRLEIKFSQMKSKAPEPGPIVFKIGIMLPPESEGQMSKIVPAGAASPYHSLDEVPSTSANISASRRRKIMTSPVSGERPN